jgi:hydroxymethylpyrimidine/phosphomethylpyrimidine kinase
MPPFAHACYGIAMTTPLPPRILSIAGSDSSGGAGIQADIKTITMLGGYAMTAVTAITAQNTVGVQGIAAIAPDMVAQQIASCIDDIGVDAIKIGMLHDPAVIAAVAGALAKAHCGVTVPIVLDPVMIATSGAVLVGADAVAALRAQLFPLATLLTPNLPELAHLAGRPLATTQDMIDAAEELAEASGAAVLAKGGHMPENGESGDRITDVLIVPGARAVAFDHARIDTVHTHGTGCTLSSAIATLLGHGQPLEHAVRLARQFVVQAIGAAPGFGAGHGPLGHQAVRAAQSSGVSAK